MLQTLKFRSAHSPFSALSLAVIVVCAVCWFGAENAEGCAAVTPLGRSPHHVQGPPAPAPEALHGHLPPPFLGARRKRRRSRKNCPPCAVPKRKCDASTYLLMATVAVAAAGALAIVLASSKKLRRRRRSGWQRGEGTRATLWRRPVSRHSRPRSRSSGHRMKLLRRAQNPAAPAPAPSAQQGPTQQPSSQMMVVFPGSRVRFSDEEEEDPSSLPPPTSPPRLPSPSTAEDDQPPSKETARSEDAIEDTSHTIPFS